MDIEAIQLLNLSPIPELSEIELSTMMDQLSGLSDINGDFSNQNVEDILKKAEDLIDNTSTSKTTELNEEKISDTEEDKLINATQESDELKSYAENDFQKLLVEDGKHYNSPVNSEHVIDGLCSESDVQKHSNILTEKTPPKIFSPEGSSNHIKSTIDLLKEYSTMIEKQLSDRSPNLSPKCNKGLKKNEGAIENKETIYADIQTTEKSNFSKIVKTPDSVCKKNLSDPQNKSVKLLNCFERLYQNKPVRLCTSKKPKSVDKIPKGLSKKLTKDLKGTLKNNKSGKNMKILLGDDVINSVNTNQLFQNGNVTLPQTSERNLLNYHQTSEDSFNNYQNHPDLKGNESKITDELLLKNMRNDSMRNDSENNGSNLILSKVDQALILKVLEEVEQIKSQVKKAGILDNRSTTDRATVDDQGVIDNLKSEVESVREKVTSVSNAGIKRLQEQFSLLKFKYYQQMDKLEAENLKLREALHSQQKFFASRKNAIIHKSPPSQGTFPKETKDYKTSVSCSPFSCETDKVTQNSPDNHTVSSGQNTSEVNLLQKAEKTSVISKEAFCQTEKEIIHRSTQCIPDFFEDGKKETVAETKKTDNKENVTLKKKIVRCKPFSDVGIHQLVRQKKLIDHESQLLATLRGLQTELTVKDKENKKMKTEIESLKKQIKKLGNNRVESCKKSHIGTQTIGLGPCVQKPYISEYYEVPREFEKENEDLKSRIKALEVDFELLKEKRVNDLQSLHQIHEEEIAKLVSKLETQCSLTKHLHSLLVNR